MPVISDSVPDSLRARLGKIAEPEPSRRETHEKREALVERDGHTDFKGQRCSPCVDCGRVFISSGLRLTRDHPRLLCRRCFAEAKGVRP